MLRNDDSGFFENLSETIKKSENAAPLLCVCVMILMLISGYVLPGIFTDFSPVNMLISAYALSFLLPGVVFGVIFRKKAQYNFRAAAKGTFKFSFAATFLLVCAAILTKCIISFVTGNDSSGTGALLSSSGLFESLLCYTVLPAVLEEFIFRGIAFSVYQKTCGGFGAIFATSVFFGLAHFSEEEFLSYFVSGIILGTVAYITRSVFPSMILHFVNNTVGFFLENAVFKIASETKSGILAIFLITAACLVLLFWFLYELEGVCKKRYLSSPKDNKGEIYPTLVPTDGNILTSVKRMSLSPLFVGGIIIFAIFSILS